MKLFTQLTLKVTLASLLLLQQLLLVVLILMSHHGKSVLSLHLHLFRLGDLRLHDNPALHRTIANVNKAGRGGAASVGVGRDEGIGFLPIFCFDTRLFGDWARSEWGSLKCSPRRAKFILESVQDLRHQLQQMGSGLLVAYGRPEDVCLQLLETINPSRDRIPRFVCQAEVCSEEQRVERALRAALKKHHPEASLESVWGSTLYEISDLPFDDKLGNMPDVFTPFRNKLEKNCKIRNPLPTPLRSEIKLMEGSDKLRGPSWSLDYMPTLADLGYTEQQVDEASTFDKRGVMPFRGGETAALARVKDYIWEKDLLKVYFDTRNGMIGADYSTKLAPWLAHGCVSPRYVARECRKYEEDRVANKSTYWVIFELLWRDFFKFFAKKHGNSIFFPGGTVGSDQKWGFHPRTFEMWKKGRTGFPLVDANMRELAATGFMSNRGRQNVCSFLAIDLNQDWRYGADYFESTLIDYDVHSNWGNWCSGAGMTGGRLNRFNIVKQSKDYDQYGDYVRHWLPELAKVPNEFVHEPWKMTQFQQMEYDCRLGVDYPYPIIPPTSPSSGPPARSNDESRRGSRTTNSNRGRGQRQDMKSLKQGRYRFDG